MKLIVKQTSRIQGEISVPSSKSQSIRGLLVALLAEGKSYLHNFLDAEDTRAALEVCRVFGAQMTLMQPACHRYCLKIISKGAPFKVNSSKIYTGNSGLTTYFFLPLLGLRKKNEDEILFQCAEQMKVRPIKPLVEALQNLGMECTPVTTETQLPMKVKGALRGGKTEVEGFTSQYLSALLFSAVCAPKDSEIIVKDLHERPYVEMSLEWLDKQAMHYKHEQKENEDVYSIKGRQKFKPINYIISGDFSSASYFIAASVLLPGTINIKGLNFNDSQGDKQFIEILKEMGADIKVKFEKVTIRGGKKLTGTTVDMRNIPDLLPALAVVATQAEGKTSLINVGQARIKETDRIHSMCEGLKKMGAKVEEKTHGMVIHESKLSHATVQGNDDHRTIMALAVAGLVSRGGVEIISDQFTNKTFPDFGKLMKSIGAQMELKP